MIQFLTTDFNEIVSEKFVCLKKHNLKVIKAHQKKKNSAEFKTYKIALKNILHRLTTLNTKIGYKIESVFFQKLSITFNLFDHFKNGVSF